MNNKIPTQTTKNTRPMMPKVSSMDSSKKLGLEKLSAHEKSRMMKNFLSRKILLKVPDEIMAENPDKHFVFINLNKLEKSGYHHPNGYRLFKTHTGDSENLNKEKFSYANDGLVHRGEMVLAYLPKEEWEEQEMERLIFRANRDHSEVITENENLRGFHPHVKKDTEEVSLE